MKPVIQFLFCFLLSSATAVSYAQLHIVKDHAACTYGLKSDSGQWVVPAIYVNAQELRLGFALSDGAHYAYFSDSGKQVTPFQFDAIDDHDAVNSLFIEKNGKKGIITYSGKEILPPEYDLIVYDYLRTADTQTYQYMAYRESNDTIYSTMVGNDGHLYFQQVKGYVVPFGAYFSDHGKKPYAILQNNQEERFSHLGVIDTSGRILIPQLYERITMDGDFFIASGKKSTTVLDKDNHIVHPAVVSLACYYYFDGPVHTHTYIAHLQNATWMLLDHHFQPLPGIYDSISNNSGIQVFLNGKTGVVNPTGEVRIPIIYESLRPLVHESSGYSSSYHRELSFLCELNGKYGLIDASGKTLIPAKYDLPEGSWYRETGTCYLKKGKNVFFVSNDSTQPLLRKADFCFQKDTLLVYLDGNQIVTLQAVAEGRFQLRYHFNLIGNFLRIDNSNRFFDKKGNELLPGTIYYLRGLSQNLTKVVTKSGHEGAFDNQTEKLVIDTVYRTLTDETSYFKSLWAQQSVSGKWQVFDLSGKLQSDLLFDDMPVYAYGTEHPKSVSVNGLQGVIDSRFRLIVPAVYQGTVILPANHFLLVSKGNKIGLANEHNQLIADTVYTDYRPVFGNYHPTFDYERGYDPQYDYNEEQYYDNCPFPEEKKIFWWLFSNGEKRLLISNNGSSVSSESLTDPNAKVIDSLLLVFAYNAPNFFYNSQAGGYYYDFEPDGSQNVVDGAFRIYWPRDTVEQLPYKEELLSLFRNMYEQSIPPYHDKSNNELGITTRTIIIPDTIVSLYPLQFGKGFLSLNRETATVTGPSYWDRNMKYAYSLSYGERSNVNYIYRSGQLQPVTINAIFGTGSLFYEELVLALNQSGTLSDYCYSPEELIEEYARQFSLSREGVRLHDEYGHYETLLIPLERLNANPQTKWITEYLR